MFHHCYAMPLRAGMTTAIVLATFSISQSATAEDRSIDGTGNNLIGPRTTWGAAETNMIRSGYMAEYPDGFGDVIDDGSRPNARDLSNTFHAQSTSVVSAAGLSDWVVQWGQFLTHDMDLTTTASAFNVLSDGSTGDFSIAINDPNDILGPNPIAFNRSNYDLSTGDDTVLNTLPGGAELLNVRQQINSVTSYIDASNVYGSDDTRAAELRTFSGGQLVTSANGLLPGYNTAGLDNDDPFGQGVAQFLAGDIRANEQVGLTATHALFVREHNRLAAALAAQNPTLTDDELYQTARKIVGAEMQAITYNEFLPALMGSAAPTAADYSYANNVNASITSAFATAAFRFGHSMQSSDLVLVDNTGAQVDTLSLASAFFDPTYLGDNPEYADLVLKGLATQTAQENDLGLVDEIRNFLFGPPGAGGLDLGALDIQRGRDHGVPDYNELRMTYGVGRVTSFAQITSDTALQAELLAQYGNVNNIDAFIGILAEDHVAGTSMGELALAMLAEQFTRLRDGDRFFYTDDADLLSADVLAVIDLDSITLSQIIELNTGLTALQDNVFFAASVGELIGDYNGDGFVSQGDLDLVLLNWGDTILPDGFDEHAIDASATFDGLVSQNELDSVLLNWGNGAPSVAAVPEPASILILAAGGVALLQRNHRRSDMITKLIDSQPGIS